MWHHYTQGRIQLFFMSEDKGERARKTKLFAGGGGGGVATNFKHIHMIYKMWLKRTPHARIPPPPNHPMVRVTCTCMYRFHKNNQEILFDWEKTVYSLL